ncbi:unnamed protein product [Plutella xylostella]|uniref:(diamondback moth) hypothetical protein n=1 Tax=Plutella xylostella TaxID=51655 RepID=A0A8S4EMY4_PLUXY|nr:unnamed protein product [Plutella xylostella]
MYGSEAWTLTLKEENKLLVAERKVMRKMLGPTRREDGCWRVRKNQEIEDLISEPNIIGQIKSQRLRWLGHLQRMGEDRAAKRAYLGIPSGRRPVGRPKYRWSDEVGKDLRQLQAGDWRATAQDRDQWRLLVSEAKIHFGSLSQRSKYVLITTVETLIWLNRTTGLALGAWGVTTGAEFRKFGIGWKYTNAWLAGNLCCKLLLVLRAFGLYLSSNVLVCISIDRKIPADLAGGRRDMWDFYLLKPPRWPPSVQVGAPGSPGERTGVTSHCAAALLMATCTAALPGAAIMRRLRPPSSPPTAPNLLLVAFYDGQEIP